MSLLNELKNPPKSTRPIRCKKGPPPIKKEAVLTLPITMQIERNLLGVPICVLNPKSAKSSLSLVYKWTALDNDGSPREMTYKLTRIGDSPFPTTIHAKYISILIGLFAENWREDGKLYFTLELISRLAGNPPNSMGAIASIIETILRYMSNNLRWDECYKVLGGTRTKSETGEIIVACNLFTSDGKLKRNPRNTKNKEEHWHMLQFNDFIVKSLKESYARIFYTKSLTTMIEADSMAVYRYFYGFSDLSEVKRSIEVLTAIFPWYGRQSRFLNWLADRLDECKKAGLIDYYKFEGSFVIVKCTKLKEIQKQNNTTISIPATTGEDLTPKYRLKVKDNGELTERKIKPIKRVGATKVKPDNLTPEAALITYQDLCEKNLVSSFEMEIAEALLKSNKDLAIKNIKTIIKKYAIEA
jgi:hypothetical protein